MSMSDDDRPVRKVAHEIGCDLSLLSAAELATRIALLKEEISRLEEEVARKDKSRSAAEKLFR